MYPTFLLPKGLLFLFVFFIGFGPLASQDDLPTLEMKKLEETASYTIYQYTLVFPDTGAYTNPPPSWIRSEEDNELFEGLLDDDDLTTDTTLLAGSPQWHFLFITNEGKYHSFWINTEEKRKPLIFRDTFINEGTHSVLLTGTPIYSPTDKPKRKRYRFSIEKAASTTTNNNQIPRSLNPSNFPPNATSMTMLGEAPCPGVIPGDTIPLAFAVRNLTQSTQTDQIFEVVLPHGKVRVVDENILNNSKITTALKDEATSGEALIENGRLWRWSLPELLPNEEISLFVDVVISDTLSSAEVLNIAYGFRSKSNETNASQFEGDIGNDEFVGSSKVQEIKFAEQKDDSQSLEIATFNGADSVLSIAVNRSRDPNRLEYYPDFIPLGSRDLSIRQRIFFQNVGNAEVLHLRILASKLHRLINASSFRQECKSCMLSRNFVVDIDEVYFPALPKTNTRRILLFDARRAGGILPGAEVIQERSDILSTLGYIEANFKTASNHTFQIGDEIIGHAHINMDGNKLSTSDTIRTIELPKFRVPSRFGFKIGVNSVPVPQFASFHGGLFGLIPLCASRPLAFGSTQLSNADMPDFYLQPEVLFNHIRPANAMSGYYNDFISLDFPVQVRWIPYDVFGTTLNRKLALSLGLTPSYVLKARDYIGSRLADKSGFELYGHGDIAMTNLFHRRLFGLGLRYNLLLTKGIGKERTDNYLQTYLQFNF